ncbi:MAG: pyruvate kinase [Nanoarchaeota archaeon]
MKNKQTKIIATVSDLNCSKAFLKQLYENGVNVIRLNTAHQTPEATLKIIRNIREVSDRLSILIDTKGPEIRTTSAEDNVILESGKKIMLEYGQTLSDQHSIKVNHSEFSREVEKGATILIDDGHIELHVDTIRKGKVFCTIIDGGLLKSRKGVNVPNARFSLAALTEKDKEYIRFAIEHDIDFIAHSFVRSAKDVLEIQKRLDRKHSKTKIIAKIENTEGYESLDEILPHVYGIMIARGDLAVEMSPEQIPVIQKNIIRRSIQWAKPVIVATQMLESMIENPRPTRAEVSDVANAILDGADAVMLSGETAYGKYPIKAVQMMSKVAKKVEPSKKAFRKNRNLKWNNPIHEFFARTAIEACADLDIRAIFAVTCSGATARLLSTFRGKVPIYAETFSERVVRELALVYGVYPHYIKKAKTTDKLVEKASKSTLKKTNLGDTDLVLFVGSTPGCKSGTDFMEIKKVAEIH